MDEHDFFDALAHRPIEGEVLLRKLKTANAASDFIRKNAVPIAGALAGGAILGTKQYLDSRPGPSGKSSDQETTQRMEKAMQDRMDGLKQQGKTPGFSDEMASHGSKTLKGMADVLAKHPGRGALMALPAGLSMGWAIGKRVAKHL